MTKNLQKIGGIAALGHTAYQIVRLTPSALINRLWEIICSPTLKPIV